MNIVKSRHKAAHEKFFSSPCTFYGAAAISVAITLSSIVQDSTNIMLGNAGLAQLSMIQSVILIYFGLKLAQMIAVKISSKSEEKINSFFKFLYTKIFPFMGGVGMLLASAQADPSKLSSPLSLDSLTSHPVTLTLGALMLLSGILYCAWSSAAAHDGAAHDGAAHN